MNNKFTTYFLYSIGEIFLVVIGILIAVNIDDWNQEKENENAEQLMLQSILVELKSNETLLKEAELAIQLQRSRTRDFIDLMSAHPHDSSISKLSSEIIFMGTEVYMLQLNTIGIQSLLNSSIKLFSNDSLKHAVLQYPVLLKAYKDQEDLMRRLTDNSVRPKIKEHINLRNFANQSLSFESDLVELLSDRMLANHLQDRLWESSDWSKDLLALRSHGQKLITQIENYLKEK